MIRLSCDLGEGSGADEEILPLVDVASVCCGAHAGSPELAVWTARLCLRAGVEVGAHPGYPDRAGFGRRELGLGAGVVEGTVREQVGLLARAEPLADPAAAGAVARVASEHWVALVAEPGSELLAAAARLGLAGRREGFADRAYLPRGGLVPRTRRGSLLSPCAAAGQALRLARTGGVDVLCIHGDSPDALAVASAVRRALEGAGLIAGRTPPPG
ncbi:MAG: LamB/YcsF family protein [Candidatus Dormibacterales bacterium]